MRYLTKNRWLAALSGMLVVGALTLPAAAYACNVSCENVVEPQVAAEHFHCDATPSACCCEDLVPADEAEGLRLDLGWSAPATLKAMPACECTIRSAPGIPAPSNTHAAVISVPQPLTSLSPAALELRRDGGSHQLSAYTHSRVADHASLYLSNCALLS